MRCEDICDVDDEDCVNCDNDGAVLETLNVKRGWWRATRTSLRVYECPLDRSCRGGASTTMQCFDGHIGALCGGCDDGFDFDVPRNRCARCVRFGDMMSRGNFFFLIVMTLTLAVLAYLRLRHGSWWTRTTTLVRDYLQGLGFLDEEDDEDVTQEGSNDVSIRRRTFGKSIMGKIKIIITATQIAASIDTVRSFPRRRNSLQVLFQVHFPPIFSKVTHIFGILGFDILEVGSAKCLVRWSYFDKLLFVSSASSSSSSSTKYRFF